MALTVAARSVLECTHKRATQGPPAAHRVRCAIVVVDVVRRPDGLFVLDFNNAYNPACAVSDHYNCPIPPKANGLRVPILAGEVDSHYH